MGTLGRSTALGSGSGGSGSGLDSGAARFEAAEEKTTVDDSVGRGGSGGELVRSFVELVKTVEAKVSAGMSFGELDTCMSSFRGSESVGEMESGLGDERRVVSIGSKTNSDANVNGNCCSETRDCSGVNGGVEENGNSCDVTKADSGVNNGALDEIGGHVDGETEVTEVPVAGTSENGEGREGEELGDGVYEFCVGDFVWGKIKNHPWWPGQICDPSDASEHAAKLRSKDKFLVAYFGDDTFAWCHPSQLKPFEENFVEKSKLSSSSVFVIAVQQAMEEISRLVKLNMSCTCMGEEFLSSCNRPLASNAGLKEGVVVPEGRVGKLFGHLSQPVGLLAELKHIAQVPCVTSSLELNVLNSLLSAFYFSKGGYHLPVYSEPQLIPGLEDERKMVEVSVQWSSDDRSSPLGLNTGNPEQLLLQRSPPSIENRQPHKRKEKSIADLLGEENGLEAKSMDVVIGAISKKRGVSSSQKKQKSSDIHDEGSLKSSDERAELFGSPISTKKAPLARRRKQGEDIQIDSSGCLSIESNGEKKESKKTPLSRKRKGEECISSDDKDGDALQKAGGTDKTKKSPLSRRRKNNENFHINSNDGEANVEELPNVGLQTDMDQIDKGTSSRERKKSKYLSPPFIISDTRKRKANLELESPNAVTSQDLGADREVRGMELVVSLDAPSKSKFGERMTRAAATLKGCPQVLNHCSQALQEIQLIDGENNSTVVKTPKGNEKKLVDPLRANAATNEVLSGVLSAAVDPLYPVNQKSSYETVGDFVSIFRDSVFSNGCYSKLYNKHQGLGKRKKSESDQTAANEGESGEGNIKLKQVMVSAKSTKKKLSETRSAKRRKLNSVIKSLGKDNGNAENLPVSGSGQRNINSNQDKPKKKPVAESPISKRVRRRSKHAEAQDLKVKETEEVASPTFLFVTFGPGSSLPTKDDLLKIYGKFGKLNVTETEMFYTNFCARVAFAMSSDAEEAFNHSLIHSPFGASDVNFRLQNPPGAAKTRELSALPESPPAKQSRAKTASEASVAPETPAGQPSQAGFIRHKLEMMTSMLGSSDRKLSRSVTSKLKNEIKDLLKVVSTMGESSY